MEVIIVTGAGGPAGIAVIQTLQNIGHYVIGADAAADAAGLTLADEGRVIPLATDTHLANAINIIPANTLISTVPDEMPALDGLGIAHWFPTKQTLGVCADKWTFYRLIYGAGIPTPQTTRDPHRQIRGPWILKPRIGSGGRDVRYTNDRTSIPHLFRDDDIIQTHIDGAEFTADCLIGRDGEPHACVLRWRLATRGGISVKGETFADDAVTQLCYKTLRVVGLTGIANVQGFVTDAGVVITECNPRFSGGLPLTIAAGANLPGEFVRMVHDQSYVPHITYRSGVKMTRYFADIFQ